MGCRLLGQRHKLAKLLKVGFAVFGYTCNVDENWDFRLIVEGLQDADPDKLYPVFLRGERCYPPGHCGSVPA